MLTKDATRKAVIAAVKAAAKAMKAGDIFFLTYSGHGGQVPDFNGDEALDDPNDFQDETLCLYDGQIVDDELYALWAAFPADSRVLVLSDCCHSGSNIKARLIADLVADAETPDQRPRVMPLAVAARVARRQPRLLQGDLGQGHRQLGRPGDPRDGAAGGGQRAADLGLPGQPGGDGRARPTASSPAGCWRPGAKAPSRATTPPSTAPSSTGCRRSRPRTSTSPAIRARPTTPSGRSTSDVKARRRGTSPEPPLGDALRRGGSSPGARARGRRWGTVRAERSVIGAWVPWWTRLRGRPSRRRRASGTTEGSRAPISPTVEVG